MSMHFHRNVVIPVSFAVFAIAMIIGPAVNAINVVFSLFVLVLGLAVSTMVYALWHTRPVAEALVAPSAEAGRRQATGIR